MTGVVALEAFAITRFSQIVKDYAIRPSAENGKTLHIAFLHFFSFQREKEKLQRYKNAVFYTYKSEFQCKIFRAM